jgi:hypothetical protein
MSMHPWAKYPPLPLSPVLPKQGSYQWPVPVTSPILPKQQW